jgi:NAD(P)-dependent dehydrogenase (short-subunit alcohol dehydrogenase family)
VKRPLFSLEGSVAVVTGALGLLGRQHCLALASAGAAVAVADLDDHLSSEFARDLGCTHERATLGRGVDVTDPESVAAFAIAVERALGPVDVLVNNAAIDDKFIPVPGRPPGAFEAYELGRWQALLDVNLTGVFLCSREIGVRMARRGRGSIVNVASTYGLVAPDQSLYRRDDGTQVFFKGPAYSASKGGVVAFTRFLAAYWGRSGVRVNTLSPGGVRTDQDDDFVDRYARRTPLGRMAAPGDYHGAIVFLASDASAYMTGANLVVDGGWTAW